MFSPLEQIRRLGAWAIDLFASVGRATIILWHALVAWPQKHALSLTIKQLFAVGVLSLIITIVSGGFIGMVLGIQGYSLLQTYGSEQAVGQMVALTLLRELGPVVTALLFAGRAGSALTAEIGLMKATEQLASMEMMGVDPLRRVVAPRFWGAFLAMPLLSLIFNSVGIISSSLVVVDWLGVYEGAFWGNMQNSVEFRYDLLNGCIKSVIFGIAVAWIALFQGYDCVPTSEGISVATTRTVVYSSLWILGLDFVLTALMFGDF